MFGKYCLVNRGGDVLVNYKPGQIEMIGNKGFDFDRRTSYPTKDVLRMTYRKAVKIMLAIRDEGFEIFIYKKTYLNVYHLFAYAEPKTK